MASQSPKKVANTKFATLRHIVPGSGLTYLRKDRVMHRRCRDKRVLGALWATGYGHSPGNMPRAFVPMFQIATPIFIEGRAKGESLWDMLPEVQKQLDWARLIPETIFFELFTCFIEARYRWEEKPAYPFFEYHEYSLMVRELVRFRKAVGDCPQEDNLERPNYTSWILVDAEIYNNLAGALDVDEDESEDVQMGGTDLREDLIPPIQGWTIKYSKEKKEEERGGEEDDREFDPMELDIPEEQSK